MVNYVSPGVYVIEKDLSDYTPSLNPTVVGIVGFATKGKPNKATLITSQQKLLERTLMVLTTLFISKFK